MAVFGSVLRDDFRHTTDSPSDVDILIEFEPERVVGLIRLAGIEREFSALVGRKADLRTPQDISRYFRDEVVRAAVVLYAA